MDNFFYNVSAFIIIFYDKRYPLNPVIYDEAVLVICHSDTPPPLPLGAHVYMEGPYML